MTLSTRCVPESRLIVVGRGHGAGPLNAARIVPSGGDPDLQVLCALGASARFPRLWLCGGEPTLRVDLLGLCARLMAPDAVELGVISDGQVLSAAGAAAQLAEAGVRRVRLTLHAAVPEAHDWLVGQVGAARRALLAARAVRQAGMELELCAVLTRPTVAQLPDWVRLAARLEASAVHVERLHGERVRRVDHVMLAARLALLQGPLEHAAANALEAGVALTLEGFPVCTAPRLAPLLRSADQLEWLLPPGDGWDAFARRDRSDGSCQDCHERPGCVGAPADYVAQFGRGEFFSERSLGAHPAQAPDPATAAPARVPPPPVRGYRDPATRLRTLQPLILSAGLHGDPIGGPAYLPTPTQVWASWSVGARLACADCASSPVPPARTSRELRRALVVAAQRGASTLRVAGADVFAHPAARSLLPDTARLSFQRVELAGDVAALAEWSDAELALLKRITRIDAALYGPDAGTHDAHVGRPGAFAATLAALDRLRALKGLELGAFGILHDATALAEYARAWSSGVLPGEPQFRLAARGASLRLLAEAARALPEDSARAAVERWLPACLGGSALISTVPVPGDCFDPVLARPVALTGSDRYGSFAACACGTGHDASRCAQAVGWSLDS